MKKYFPLPLILIVLCLFIPIAQAQEVLNEKEFISTIKSYQIKIDNIDKSLLKENIKEEKFFDVRKNLRSIRKNIEKIQKEIVPYDDNVKAEISDLGPAPTDDNAEVEPKNIKDLRKKLTDESLRIEGILQQSEAISAKSSRLLEKLETLRRKQFVDKLFETQPSIFNVNLWKNSLQVYQDQVSAISTLFGQVKFVWSYKVIVLGMFFLILTLISIVYSSKKLDLGIQDGKRTVFSIVAQSLVLPYLSIGATSLVFYYLFTNGGAVKESDPIFIQKFIWAFAFFLLVAVTSRRLTQYSVIRPIIHYFIVPTAMIFAFDVVFQDFGRILGMSMDLTITQTYLVTTLFAFLLCLFSYRVLLKEARKHQKYVLSTRAFWIFVGLGIFILCINIYGYAALSWFIFEKIILVSCLVVFGIILRSVIKPYLYKLNNSLSHKSEIAENSQEENFLIFWLGLIVDACLIILFMPVLLSIFDYEWHYIQDLILKAFWGFEVGSMKVSIAGIIWAVGVFLAVLFMTRLLQKVLAKKILPKTRMQFSLQNSITQIFGYIGLVIAFMVAVSSAGFNLTNLALIASALSVGIGFGLQSIVSNFVSGLILLFERPIKVGDWIITTAGEGFVKQINVRATEIETFDRSSIIVPNSELISSAVSNWTYKDPIGRVKIIVGVSYDSDPHQVKDILLQCAKDNVYSLNYPEPSIFFQDFGDSALIFETRFFIRTVTDVILAETQARFDVWDAFKAANIEISFPQTDLHIRSADGLKGILTEKK